MHFVFSLAKLRVVAQAKAKYVYAGLNEEEYK
jgi:hypothetical protein